MKTGFALEDLGDLGEEGFYKMLRDRFVATYPEPGRVIRPAPVRAWDFRDES